MLKLNSLVAKLATDYPQLNFAISDRPRFHPPHTINYTNDTDSLVLLHEVGHYLAGAQDYQSDIELVRIEAEAWQRAKNLAKRYKIAWDEDLAQDHLDSYRDWLHNASLCPTCKLTGHQDNTSQYHCPFCGRSWPSKPLPENP